MWDMAISGVVPGLHLAAPRDGQQIPLALRAAVDISDAPSVIRFPKGTVGAPIQAWRCVGGVDVLAEPADGLAADVLLVAVGALAGMALATAQRLREQGIGVTVVDPRWVLPVPGVLGDLARAHKLVVTCEDNGVAGGVGSAVSAALRRAEIDVPCRDIGVPQRFLPHASRGELFAEMGLTDRSIARQITGWVAAQGASLSDAPEIAERRDG